MMKRHFAITRCALFVFVGLLALTTAGSQTSTLADTFPIKGLAADANGPLTGKILLVMPISASYGRPVTRHSRAAGGGLPRIDMDATFGTGWALNPETNARTYYYTISNDAGDGPRLNPQTTTDAKGAFSVNVPKILFKVAPGCVSGCTGYKAGELGLAVFDGLRSSFEVEIVKYDVNASTVDVGRLVFKPVRAQSLNEVPVRPSTP